MSRLIGNRLPAEIVRAFDGTRLEEKIGLAYLLVTVDEDCSPRTCMLSVGEILTMGDRAVRVALWPKTRTAENLARGKIAMFCYMALGDATYVRARPHALTNVFSSRLECFELTVESVESDLHAGMPVTGGITFIVEDMDPETVVTSWADQIDALRAAKP